MGDVLVSLFLAQPKAVRLEKAIDEPLWQGAKTDLLAILTTPSDGSMLGPAIAA